MTRQLNVILNDIKEYYQSEKIYFSITIATNIDYVLPMNYIDAGHVVNHNLMLFDTILATITTVITTVEQKLDELSTHDAITIELLSLSSLQHEFFIHITSINTSKLVRCQSTVGVGFVDIDNISEALHVDASCIRLEQRHLKKENKKLQNQYYYYNDHASAMMPCLKLTLILLH